MQMAIATTRQLNRAIVVLAERQRLTRLVKYHTFELDAIEREWNALEPNLRDAVERQLPIFTPTEA